MRKKLFVVALCGLVFEASALTVDSKTAPSTPLVTPPKLTQQESDVVKKLILKTEGVAKIQANKEYDTPVQLDNNNMPKPIYPISLRQSGNSGFATLSVTIDAQGYPHNPVVIKATHPAFGEAAIEAVLKWHFHPAQKNGKPVESTATIPMNFVLDNNKPQEAYKINSDDDQSNLPAEFRYDIAPKIKVTVAPVYPVHLLKSETTGTAQIKFLVNKDGTVSYASIASASHPDFGKAAKAMMEAWQFEPATKAGQATMSILLKEQKSEIRGGENVVSEGTRKMLTNLEDEDVHIYSLQELDAVPKALFQVKPVYPDELHEKKLSGKAVIKCYIDEEGRVQLPEIASATHEDFGWSAATAVSQWRFEPPKKEGKAVIVQTEIPIRFQSSEQTTAKP